MGNMILMAGWKNTKDELCLHVLSSDSPLTNEKYCRIKDVHGYDEVEKDTIARLARGWINDGTLSPKNFDWDFPNKKDPHGFN